MITWYAVYTRAQGEATARDNLLRQGYCAYLPTCRAEIRHARRRQVVRRPLFPRYLFAGIDRAVMRWRPILSTLGVSDLVRTGDSPLPVPAAIVAALQAREAVGAFDRIGAAALCPGTAVRITGGVFDDMIGRLVALRDQDRVVVLLDLLGRAVRAEFSAGAVEAA